MPTSQERSAINVKTVIVSKMTEHIDEQLALIEEKRKLLLEQGKSIEEALALLDNTKAYYEQLKSEI